MVSLFSGVGLTVFLLLSFSRARAETSAEIIDQIPFEIDPVVKIIWLFGLLPVTSGVGHIIAGLLIRPQR